jgi:hypothetical protein
MLDCPLLQLSCIAPPRAAMLILEFSRLKKLRECVVQQFLFRRRTVDYFQS